MSEKEFAMQLINNLPDYKLGYVIAYLQGLTADEAAKGNTTTPENKVREYGIQE